MKYQYKYYANVNSTEVIGKAPHFETLKWIGGLEAIAQFSKDDAELIAIYGGGKTACELITVGELRGRLENNA